MILTLLALLAHAEEPRAEEPRADEARAEAPLPLPAPRPGRVNEPAPRYGTTGFRLVVPAGGHAATTRLAFVQDFDGATIAELTLRGQAAWQRASVGVELVGTAGASDAWSSAGVGNLSLDGRYLFGRTATHALGLHGTAPIGNRDGARGPVAWWGTVPEATIPAWSLALAYSGGTRRWAWHTRVGLGGSAWWTIAPDLAAGVVTVQPLAERWELVGELEIQWSASPVHVRALARRDLGHGWQADAGVAFPAVVFFADPTLQLLGRVERRW